MASVLDPRELEGFSDRLDALDDPGSATFALEDLLGRASDECPSGRLDELTWLLDVAHDHFECGEIEAGTATLVAFQATVEDMREAGTMSAGFAGQMLSLSEAAIGWAGESGVGEIVEESLWLDELPGDPGFSDL
ncbi:hypothetical protein HQ535_03960 [bacterium]|nr:hypothetical protein [bacterium]